MGHEQAHVKPDRLVWKREDHTFGKLSSVSTALGSLSTGTETGVGDMLGFLQSMDNPPMTPAEDKVFMQIWDDPPALKKHKISRDATVRPIFVREMASHLPDPDAIILYLPDNVRPCLRFDFALSCCASLALRSSMMTLTRNSFLSRRT